MTHRATYALMMIVVVLVATWLMSSAGGDDDAGDQRAVMPAADEMPEMPRMLPRGEGAAPEELGEAHDVDESEPAAAPAMTPAADTLTLVVQHAHGAPAQGARLGLQRDADSAWLATGWLDDAGRFSSSAFNEPLEVVVVGATLEPVRFVVDEPRGEHTLTLPAGAVIEGVVLIDGAPPGEPFPIGLSGFRHPSLKLDGEVRFPRFARPGYVETVYGSGVFTDAEGRFVLSGLPAGDELRFRWPRLHRLVEFDSTPQPVRAPSSGVVISLRAPKYLFGRVVHADGSLATDALLRAVVKAASLPGWEHGNPPEPREGTMVSRSSSATSTYSDIPVDDEARFFVALGDLLTAQGSLPSVERGELDLERLDVSVLIDAECEHGVASLVFERVDLTRDQDLGDVLVQPPALARLVVLDEAEQPLAEARVRVELRQGQPPVLEVDADGRVEFRLPSGALGVVTVLAPGYESVRFAPILRRDADDERVVLRRANSLTLRFLGPWAEGEARDAWKLEAAVFAHGSPFQDASHAPVEGLDDEVGPDPMRPRGPSASGGSTSHWNDGNVLVGWATREDSVRFEALRTHHPITAHVRVLRAPESAGVEQGAWVWEQDVWLEPGEQRELNVDLRDVANIAPAKAK